MRKWVKLRPDMRLMLWLTLAPIAALTVMLLLCWLLLVLPRACGS